MASKRTRRVTPKNLSPSKRNIEKKKRSGCLKKNFFCEKFNLFNITGPDFRPTIRHSLQIKEPEREKAEK